MGQGPPRQYLNEMFESFVARKPTSQHPDVVMMGVCDLTSYSRAQKVCLPFVAMVFKQTLPHYLRF